MMKLWVQSCHQAQPLGEITRGLFENNILFIIHDTISINPLLEYYR